MPAPARERVSISVHLGWIPGSDAAARPRAVQAFERKIRGATAGEAIKVDVIIKTLRSVYRASRCATLVIARPTLSM